MRSDSEAESDHERLRPVLFSGAGGSYQKGTRTSAYTHRQGSESAAEIDEELQGIFSLPNMSMAFSVAIANAAAASLGVPLYRYLGGFFANANAYPLPKNL